MKIKSISNVGRRIIKNGNIYDKAKIMAEVDGYIMCRYPTRMPFIISERELKQNWTYVS